MANIKSQIKRIRQNEKRRARNSKVKSSIRTASKRVTKAINAKDNTDTVKDLYRSFVKSIDKAVGAGILHKNTAARKKSRLAKQLNAELQSRS